MNQADKSLKPDIPGYGFGSTDSARSPLSMEDLSHLEQTLGWTAIDGHLLLKHADLFRQQAEEMVAAWRTVIGAQPHLSMWFASPDGKPDDEYKARVKRRFVQWVIDVATRPHDQAWLNYQEEIGLRHTPEKKNKTDRRNTPPLVPLRYLLAFIPVVADVRKFFSPAITDPEELAAVEKAWVKAVHLHITLWSRPYTRDELW
jgi:Protoglobin